MMGLRARGIKPGFWINEKLGQLPFEWRLLFAGLWCAADREGLLEERPDRIRAELFPYDHDLDVAAGLELLGSRGFILRYEAQGLRLLHILNFRKHQTPHHTERRSSLPPPGDGTQVFISFPEQTRAEVKPYLQRIWKLAQFQSEDWRDWVTASLGIIVQAGHGANVYELLEYMEKCADSVQRKAKDLGQLKNPAGYVVKSIRSIAVLHSLALPPSPRLKKEAANG